MFEYRNYNSDKNIVEKHTKEIEEIKDFTRLEFERRKFLLKSALSDLDISESLIVLAPPLLERTDLGHSFDLEFIFLGSLNQQLELERRLLNFYKISPNITCINSNEIKDMHDNFPELDELIEDKNNLNSSHLSKTIIDSINEKYWDTAPIIEQKMRKILTKEEKIELKKERIEIGEKFIKEIEEKMSVSEYIFSGSMMNNMERFGINSDIDLEVVLDIKNEQAKKSAFLLTRRYLKWKYIKEYGVEVDCHYSFVN